MRYHSLFIMSLALVSCSSWKNESKREIASNGNIFGEWKLTTATEKCKDTLKIAMTEDGTAVSIEDDKDGAWILPLRANDDRNDIDKICGATIIDSEGILTRDCKGTFQTNVGISLEVKINWKIIPIGANGLDYTFFQHDSTGLINHKPSCIYNRVGAPVGEDRPTPLPQPPVDDFPTNIDLPPSAFIRPEPLKPQTSGVEDFEYKEISRQSFGANRIGKLTENLASLSEKTEKLRTFIAPMKVTYERRMWPCFTEGEGRQDPKRCDTVVFDRAVLGKRFEKDVLIGIGASQNSDIELKGEMDVTLDVDGTLKYNVRNVDDNIAVGVTSYNENTKKVLVKLEKAAKASANLKNTLREISVSKGVLTIESGVEDLSPYLVSLKAERNPTIGFNTTILNNIFKINDSFTTQVVKNGLAIVKINMKAAIAQIGKEEYKIGKKHDFEVTIDLKEKYGSSMKDYTIIKTIKNLSLEPVMKGIYKTKVD